MKVLGHTALITPISNNIILITSPSGGLRSASASLRLAQRQWARLASLARLIPWNLVIFALPSCPAPPLAANPNPPHLPAKPPPPNECGKLPVYQETNHHPTIDLPCEVQVTLLSRQQWMASPSSGSSSQSLILLVHEVPSLKFILRKWCILDKKIFYYSNSEAIEARSDINCSLKTSLNLFKNK